MIVIAMDKQLTSRTVTTIVHNPCIGLTSFGDRNYDPPVNRQCYLIDKVNYAHQIDGTRIISQLTLIFDTLLSITHNDTMVVNGKQYPVIMINKFPGLDPTTGTTVVYV
jgi:hypothetical protein